MKFVVKSALLAVIFLAPNLLHAQETAAIPSSPANLSSLESYSDAQLEQVLNELAAMPLIWPTNLPNNGMGGTYWSLAHPDWPPLPCMEGIPAWEISSNFFLLDDIEYPETVSANSTMSSMGMFSPMDSGGGSYFPSFSFLTNGLLWLQITNVTGGTVYANLNNGTDFVYQIFSLTNLSMATAVSNWNTEMAVFPGNNTNVMPFTVSMNRRNPLFLWARDWTGITNNGNIVPQWWMFYWLGVAGLDLPDTNADVLGNTLRYDFTNSVPPTMILITHPTNNAVIFANHPNVTLTALTGNYGAMASPFQFFEGTTSLGIVTNAPYNLIWSNAPDGSYALTAVAVGNSGLSSTSAVVNFTITPPATAAIGGERIMELTGSGDVVSWGGNQYGELGDYTYLDSGAPLLQSNVPVHVVGLTNIITIASGMNHSLALDSNGFVWAWGQDNVDQLGDGGFEDSTNIPEQVLGVTNVIAIAASGYINGDGAFGFSLAVETNGTVWTWGAADGWFYNSTPVEITGVSNAVNVAAADTYALILNHNGSVWKWNGGTPSEISGLSNITAVCTSYNKYGDGDDNYLALDSNGVIWANGPNMVEGISNAIAIAAGASHYLALDSSGQLWAWGDDSEGQLGDGGAIGSTNSPMMVEGMTNIISIAAGLDASAVVDANNHLWQFGSSDGDSVAWLWGATNGLPMLSPQYVDFYNGQLPNLTILNGNNQTNVEFPLPLVFQVTDANGIALSNAPVSVQVVAGDMTLRTVSGGTNYQGLRLTTDANGDVSLLGYDSSINDTGDLIRVLAASRENIRELDFSEGLIAPPTISITSPTNGGAYLVTTNQPFFITVDTETAQGVGGGASVHEVDYYYGTNGCANMLLGVSTESPFSFVWTNASWWSNAFYGQYTVSAVAIDNEGGPSAPAPQVTFTIALDSADDGLPDYWQIEYFGTNGLDPNSSPDGNGQSLLYDYTNGIVPILSSLNIIWPQNGTPISGSNFTLQAQVNDPAVTVTASIVDTNGDTNTVQGLVEQDGAVWVQNLPLVGGTNTLTVTATDRLGNQATTNLTVTQSSVILTMNPLTSDQLNQQSVDVTGTVSDTTCDVFVNGVEATNDDGTWAATNVPVNPTGMATFHVQAYVGDPVLEADQNFTQPQPPMVVVSSYSALGYYASTDSLGTAFFQEDDNWTWNSGGTAFITAYIEGGAGFLGIDPDLVSIPPDTNGYAAPAWDENNGDTFDPAWENSAITYFDGTNFDQRTNDTTVMLVPGGGQAAGTVSAYLVLAHASEFSVPPMLNPNWGTDWDYGYWGYLFSFDPPSWYAGDVPLPPEWLQINGQQLVNIGITNADGSVDGAIAVQAQAGVPTNVTLMATQVYTNNDYTFGENAYQLVSQCVATTPINQARTNIGVGEQVKLFFNPVLPPGLTNIMWSTTAGSLSVTNGTNTVFTAPDRLTNVTVTASVGQVSLTASFAILEPTNVFYVTNGIFGHHVDEADIGFEATVYLQPDTVNFGAVWCQEEQAYTVATGVYTNYNGSPHEDAPVPVQWSQTVVPGFGTSSGDYADTCYSGPTPTNLSLPFTPGTETIVIPWDFAVNTNNWKTNFVTLTWHCSETNGGDNGDGFLNASKSSASCSFNVDDPTVGNTQP
jgi:alpha-tubulin suppressor-like RCC1 family protein